MKYIFGEDFEYRSFKTVVDSLEEAINEFCLSIIDFGAYSYNSEFTSELKEIRSTPYGYNSNGTKNEDYIKHRYFELVPVYEVVEGEATLVKKLTLTEFKNWHLKAQNKKIGYDADSLTESKSKSVDRKIAPSMDSIQSMIRDQSLQIRNKKLEMAISSLGLTSSFASKQNNINDELSILMQQQKELQAKMDIFKLYSGIGRELLKINSGKSSEEDEPLYIYQSYRYMKEDIDILTNFKGFDGANVEDFDKFMSENYEKLLPSKKCIQAYRISFNEIEYDDVFKKMDMKELNGMTFIYIRNGENIYRLYNKYNLAKDKFFSLDEKEEVFEELFKNPRETFTREFNLYDSLVAKSEYYSRGSSSYRGHYSSSIGRESFYACDVVYTYDSSKLKELKDKCLIEYNEVVKTREDFITKHNLKDELTIDSFRFGKSLGKIAVDIYRDYNWLFENMIADRYFQGKPNYLYLYSIGHKMPNGCYFGTSGLESECVPDFESGMALLHSDFYRPTESQNDFYPSVSDPITCEPRFFYGLWFDSDKALERAIDKSTEDFKEVTKERNIYNINAIAILQNIFDANNVFPELLDIEVDLLSMRYDSDKIIFVSDSNSNLLSSSESEDLGLSSEEDLRERLFTDQSSLKKGDNVFVVRRYEPHYVHTHFGREIEPRESNSKIIDAKVTKIDPEKGAIFRGYFDVYRNDNWDKGVYMNNKKLCSTPLRKDEYWLIVNPEIINKDEIKKYLGNRYFRERFYSPYGVMLKNILDRLDGAEDGC